MHRNEAMDGYQLMIPGPIQLSSDVIEEMVRPMVPHYGTDWTVYYKDTLNLLRRVFRTEGDVFLIPGSGSAALDAAIGSCLGPSDRALILSNGWFGQRLAEIASSHSDNIVVAELSVTEPIDPADLETALDDAGDVRFVAVVHSESSSGLLNPVHELAKVCRRRGVLLLVDAISSVGGVELAMDEWGIDLCVGASQKCLEGPPGLGVVAVGKRAWPVIDSAASSGWYLNLQVWKRFADDWSDWHPYPITMAVPAVRALRRGAERIIAEGLDERCRRHRSMATRVREQLSAAGFKPVFPEEIASPTVVALRGREGCSADEVVDRLRTEHRILIARGMGIFAGQVFRIGNMGPQATDAQMDALLDAITGLAGNAGEGGNKDER
ncbi:MAG: alanine--glyoxylate aminotransferase family protein [Lentisphaeria bacterium]|nr:alanine--glyoxylate aminotransferase family protein [Lentisphaeria bacterium]